MALFINQSHEVNQELGFDVNRVLDDILKYVRTMSPQVSVWQEQLAKTTLKVADWFTEKAMGWEIHQRLDGGRGTEGALGNYRIEAQLVDLESSPALRAQAYGGRGRSVNIQTQLLKDLFLASVEQAMAHHRDDKFLSSDVTTYFNKYKTYRRRESWDPTIRIVVPQPQGEKGFVDVKYTWIREMLVERATSDNTAHQSSLLRLLSKGRTDELVGQAYGREVRGMGRWNEGGEGREEPPLLVLSLSGASEEPIRVSDPRIFAHFGIHIGENGFPKGTVFDFGHIGTWGDGADQYVEDVLTNSLSLARTENPGPDPWHSPEGLLRGLEVRSRKLEEVVGGDAEAVFGDDELLLALAKRLNVFQVDATLDLGSTISSYLRKYSKAWGGIVGMQNLALLIMEGQAPFFMIDHKGPRGLQVGLGLGGAQLLTQLRGMVGYTTGKTDLSCWSDIDKDALYSFWRSWEAGEPSWLTLYEREKKRGKNEGLATVSTMAAIVGSAQETVQKLAKTVISPWAVYMKSRWQNSSLGAISEKLQGIVGDMTFLTAGSSETGAVLSSKGESLAVQMFAKDPVLWGHAFITMVEELPSDEMKDLKEVFASLRRSWSEGTSLYQGLDEKDLDQVEQWILKLVRGGTVADTDYGEMQLGTHRMQASIRAYFRSIGEDTAMRERVLGTSCVMAALVQEALSGKGRYWWKSAIKKGLETTVAKKTTELIARCMQLSLSREMYERLPTINNRLKASEVVDGRDDVLDINRRIVWLRNFQNLVGIGL